MSTIAFDLDPNEELTSQHLMQFGPMIEPNG